MRGERNYERDIWKIIRRTGDIPFTLKNKNGMEIRVSDYGAVLVNVFVPDKNGEKRDVVLGYDNPQGYENGDKFFGAIVGRSANRIGGACFTLNGKTYRLEKTIMTITSIVGWIFIISGYGR